MTAMPEVQQVDLAASDLNVSILNHGARLQHLHLNGVAQSPTLGAETVQGYAGQMTYAGPICGPVVNRIGGAAFSIDGRPFQTDANEGADTTLHGGSGSIHDRIWRIAERSSDGVTLCIDLPDGLGGFPGNRQITARWQVSAPATLDLTLRATTDAPTPMNLAHHPYWCLDPIGGDSLSVDAEHYLPTSPKNLPVGQIAPVAGTPFDLRHPRALADPDMPCFDHNYCLSQARTERRKVATLAGKNGVTLDVATTEPCLQVFTGFDPRTAGSMMPGRFVALEPQGWPDAMNHAAFPSIILRPGQTYRQEIRYVFSGHR